MNAPTITPESCGVAHAHKLAQHVYARLLISKERGAEAHSIVDNTHSERTRGAETIGPAVRSSAGAGHLHLDEQDLGASQ